MYKQRRRYHGTEEYVCQTRLPKEDMHALNLNINNTKKYKQIRNALYNNCASSGFFEALMYRTSSNKLFEVAKSPRYVYVKHGHRPSSSGNLFRQAGCGKGLWFFDSNCPWQVLCSEASG